MILSDNQYQESHNLLLEELNKYTEHKTTRIRHEKGCFPYIKSLISESNPGQLHWPIAKFIVITIMRWS